MQQHWVETEKSHRPPSLHVVVSAMFASIVLLPSLTVDDTPTPATIAVTILLHFHCCHCYRSTTAIITATITSFITSITVIASVTAISAITTALLALWYQLFYYC